MNSLQKVGLVASFVSLLIAIIGGWLSSSPDAVAGGPAARTLGIGIVLLLVSLLIFGIGRMTAK
ncbi:MAG TPA: hypothetical protein VGN72_00330 [Tepidisphaeraceae bacterium]|jgi:hypothetical protein|nr:hypothetical protein [Tepidisphaeraceae bacterium]